VLSPNERCRILRARRFVAYNVRLIVYPLLSPQKAI